METRVHSEIVRRPVCLGRPARYDRLARVITATVGRRARRLTVADTEVRHVPTHRLPIAARRRHIATRARRTVDQRPPIEDRLLLIGEDPPTALRLIAVDRLQVAAHLRTARQRRHTMAAVIVAAVAEAIVAEAVAAALTTAEAVVVAMHRPAVVAMLRPAEDMADTGKFSTVGTRRHGECEN